MEDGQITVDIEDVDLIRDASFPETRIWSSSRHYLNAWATTKFAIRKTSRLEGGQSSKGHAFGTATAYVELGHWRQWQNRKTNILEM